MINNNIISLCSILNHIGHVLIRLSPVLTSDHQSTIWRMLLSLALLIRIAIEQSTTIAHRHRRTLKQLRLLVCRRFREVVYSVIYLFIYLIVFWCIHRSSTIGYSMSFTLHIFHCPTMSFISSAFSVAAVLFMG